VSNVLIRNVDDEVLGRLKARAKRNRRSLEAELRLVLEESAQLGRKRATAAAERLRSSLEGRSHTDSVLLVSEDRSR
jgi:antitoxin FitA